MERSERSWMQVTIPITHKIVLFIITSIILLSTIGSLCYPIILYPLHFFPNSSPKSSSSTTGDPTCDLSTGEWVPDPTGPYYTNTTCSVIHEHQNCMKYGRPDTEFMRWRWKPDGCELPLFNPAQFLEILRGKSLAFVGDSVARNHMQSLICSLSRVAKPNTVSDNRWLYVDYNFTLANFWSPFLVKAIAADTNGPTIFTGLYNLYLDEFDESWTTQIDEFNYVIISAAHWFGRPAIFYQEGRIAGCFYCNQPNMTELTLYHGYRMAMRTALEAINGLPKFKGTTFLRTISPPHFENGKWNSGGNCPRTRPFHSNETIMLDDFSLEVYFIQGEEFNRAKQAGEMRGSNFKLLDITQAMLQRPDGHPSRYGNWQKENVTHYNDCVHWCLPGPIDAWNDMLLEMIKMEVTRRKVGVR